MITEIIKFLRKNTPYEYHFDSIDVADLQDFAIVYTYQKNNDNKVKKTARLTFNIIVKGICENGIVKAESIQKEINDKVLTLGDNPFSGSILSVEQNGGGTLTNEVTDTIHLTAYYDIIYR